MTTTDSTQSSELFSKMTPVKIGIQFVCGDTKESICTAKSLLEENKKFIFIAKSIADAVYLRENLSPVTCFDEHGVPLPEKKDGSVLLMASNFSSGKRNLIFQGFVANRYLGIIFVADDIDFISIFPQLWKDLNIVWIIDSVHRASFSSTSYNHSYVKWIKFVNDNYKEQHVFAFSPFLNDESIKRDVEHVFNMPLSNVIPSAKQFRNDVVLNGFCCSSLGKDSDVFSSRENMASLFKSILNLSGYSFDKESDNSGCIVLPKPSFGETPSSTTNSSNSGYTTLNLFAEAKSIFQEFNINTHVIDSGDVDSLLSANHKNGILLTQSAGYIDVLKKPLFALIPLNEGFSFDNIVESCWSYSSRSPFNLFFYYEKQSSSDLKELSIQQLDKLIDWISTNLSQEQDSLKFITVDSTTLAKILDYPVDESKVEQFSKIIFSALKELTGTGLINDVNQVNFMLEIIDAHKFCEPHINSHNQFVELYRRYSLALTKMGMLASVSYRLASGAPKNLVKIAELTGYSVRELNFLFNDLSNEGLLLSRQSNLGLKNNANFEITVNTSFSQFEEMRANALNKISFIREERQNSFALFKNWLKGDAQSIVDMEKLLSCLGIKNTKPFDIVDFNNDLQYSTQSNNQDTPTKLSSNASYSAPSGLEFESYIDTSSNLALKISHFDYDDECVKDFLSFIYSIKDDLNNQVELSFDKIFREDNVKTEPKYITWIFISIFYNERLVAKKLLKKLFAEYPESAFLKLLISEIQMNIDYDINSNGDVYNFPLLFRKTILLLPAIENLSAEKFDSIMKQLGWNDNSFSRNFDKISLSDGEFSCSLSRKGLEPEDEEDLFVSLYDIYRSFCFPVDVLVARLIELSFIIQNYKDRPLFINILNIKLDGIPFWLEPDQFSYIQGQLYISTGDIEKAIEAFSSVSSNSNIFDEALRAKTKLLFDKADYVQVFEICITQKDRLLKYKSDFYNWMSSSLNSFAKTCQEQVSCEKCSFYESRYCPNNASLFNFFISNSYKEDRQDILMRISKRTLNGWEIDTLQDRISLLSKFGKYLDTAVIEKIVSSIPSDSTPKDIYELSQTLFNNKYLDLSLKSISLIQEYSFDNYDLAWSIIKLKLLLKDLAGGMRMLDLFVNKYPENWNKWAIIQILSTVYEKNWYSVLESESQKLDIEGSTLELIKKLCGDYKYELVFSEKKHNLHVALKKSSWSLLNEAKKAYEEFVNDAEDKLLKEAANTMQTLEKDLVADLESLCNRSYLSFYLQKDMESLIKSVEELGIADLANKAKQRLETIRTKKQTIDTTGTNDNPLQQNTTEPPVDAYSEQKIDKNQPYYSKSGNKKNSDFQNKYSSRKTQFDNKKQSYSNQKIADNIGSEKIIAEEQHSKKPLTSKEALSAISSALSDKERTRILLDALYYNEASTDSNDVAKEDLEQSYKLIRDSIPLIQQIFHVDKYLSEWIRKAKIPTEELSKIRKLLEKEQYNKQFKSSLKSIEERAPSETWKQVLGQLKFHK